MIKKIIKLKNFGIFRDFSWDRETPDCARFNLIYGWNKSGKTTLSRVFSSCEYRKTMFVQYPKGGEYEIKTDQGTSISNTNCQTCVIPIKVFNKDFIEENISFDPLNPSNPIVYISEQDIKTTEKLKEFKAKLPSVSAAYNAAVENKLRSEKDESKFRATLALEIKNIAGNLKVRDRYRDYDKATLKKKIDKAGTENFTRLSDEDFDKYKKQINEEPDQKLNKLSQMRINISLAGRDLKSCSEIQNQMKVILETKVIAETIERLKDDPDLNKWVQRGLELHKEKDEEGKCLFCQTKLETNYLKTLSKHFSDDYEKLQKTIKVFIQILSALRQEKYSDNSKELNVELRVEYRENIRKLNGVVEKINVWLDEDIEILNKKHDDPHSIFQTPQIANDLALEYNGTIDEINMLVETHNTSVDNHDNEVQKAKEWIESHLIAIAIEDQNYAKIKEEVEKCSEAEITAKSEMDKNNEEISKLEKETSNIGKALQNINKHLEDFFGRKEIQLELDDGKKGYVIKRDGEIAHNLSEGEKNAIAFSYFIAKTQERNFKISEGTIFIDDPISSFDSNFIFHCFSIIKIHFNRPGQLIISTHNFEFFNLIKDWYMNKNHKVESNNKKITNPTERKPMPCEFFMIENIVENDKRCAAIMPLEDTLKKFKSEYHFLFARLNHFVNDASPNYADFYTIGNIARRFLEIYANFKIPTTGDLAGKIEQLETSTVDETERQKVYRLVQEFSHSLDPISAIEHKDKTESQEAIKILMKIVEESDGAHFAALKSNLN